MAGLTGITGIAKGIGEFITNTWNNCKSSLDAKISSIFHRENQGSSDLFKNMKNEPGEDRIHMHMQQEIEMMKESTLNNRMKPKESPVPQQFITIQRTRHHKKKQKSLSIENPSTIVPSTNTVAKTQQLVARNRNNKKLPEQLEERRNSIFARKNDKASTSEGKSPSATLTNETGGLRPKMTTEATGPKYRTYQPDPAPWAQPKPASKPPVTSSNQAAPKNQLPASNGTGKPSVTQLLDRYEREAKERASYDSLLFAARPWLNNVHTGKDTKN